MNFIYKQINNYNINTMDKENNDIHVELDGIEIDDKHGEQHINKKEKTIIGRIVKWLQK